MTGTPTEPGRTKVVRRSLVVAVVVLVAFGPATVQAADPGEPISFHGAAVDGDGTPAPEGTVVVATVDGEAVDRVTVDATGVYAGDGPTDEKLRTHTQAGDEVTFHVGDADGPQAAETHAIDGSGVFEVDLTFPAGTFEAETTDPSNGEETDGSDGAGGGGGGGTGGTGDGSGGPDADAGSSGDRVTVEATMSTAGDTGVRTASVSASAAANSTLEIALADDESGAEDGPADQSTGDGSATVERIAIDVAADVDAEVEIRQSPDPPDDAAPRFEREDGTMAAGYLQVETNVANDDVTSARIDFRLDRATIENASATPGDVALYHFDEAAGEWEELPTTVVDESEETDGVVRFRAETDGFSTFAAGVKRPRIAVHEAAVTDAEVALGDGVAVEVVVENAGGADGTAELGLAVDGEVVVTESVAVPANERRSLRLDHEFGEPGTYTLRVDDVPAGEVSVAATDAGDSQDDGAMAGEGDDGEPAAGTDAPGEPGGGAPVLPLVLALLVVAVGVAAVAWRRRRRGADDSPFR